MENFLGSEFNLVKCADGSSFNRSVREMTRGGLL
jgi:hypothetical protein